MPVRETERPTAPRSALRYRQIDPNQAAVGPVVSRTRRSRLNARVPSGHIAPDHLDLEEEEHLPRRRRTVVPTPPQNVASPVHTGRRFHPLFFVIVGLLVTLLLWIGVTQIIAWSTTAYNNLVYGSPRTFQTDAVVGDGDSTLHPSHFVAVNLRGTVTIIEFPAGDPSRARVLETTSVLGPDADQAVVTLRFIAVKQHEWPDMLITIDGMQSVFVNDQQGHFRLPIPTEQQQISRYLQQHP